MRHLNFTLVFSLFLSPFIARAQADPEPETKDKIFENITFLNAANFDFNDNFDVSYLGKLNIFAPNIAKSRYGFNAGIMRVKFNYSDTSHSRYYIENRKISPLDSLNHGKKYLREYNKYTTTRTNNVWSFYVQPMLRIFPCSADQSQKENAGNNIANGIYLHAHIELLVNKISVSTSIENLKRDTALVDTAVKNIAYFYYPSNKILDDRSFLNGYFGLGVTFSLDPFGNGNSHFFFQPTIGWTTNYPSWTNQEITSTTVSVVPTRSSATPVLQVYEPAKNHIFYLVRAEFRQYLSSNSQIIVGTDIRGLFPKFNPLYAAYAGLNVNLNALAGIFSDKTKKASADE